MSVPKYKVGDVIYVYEQKEPVTITSIVSATDIIGYGGSYIAYWRGEPVAMTIGWIPEKLIVRKLSAWKVVDKSIQTQHLPRQ